MKTRNILFDLGGVLLDIDFNRPVLAFQALGFQHFEGQYNQHAAGPLFEKFEKGEISEPDFYEALRKAGGLQADDAGLEMAWNSILGSFRKESLDFILGLKDRFMLALLSNTNSIHHRAFSGLLQREFGVPGLEHYMHYTWYSHTIGLRKPDPESFLYCCRMGNMRPEETLFIDDTSDNIDAAGALGFQVLHLLPGQRIEQLLGDVKLSQ